MHFCILVTSVCPAPSNYAWPKVIYAPERNDQGTHPPKHTQPPYSGPSCCLWRWFAWSWKLHSAMHLYQYLFLERLYLRWPFGVGIRICPRDMHLTSMFMHYNKTVSCLTATIVLIPAGSTQRLCWASRLRSCLEHTLLTEISSQMPSTKGTGHCTQNKPC